MILPSSCPHKNTHKENVFIDLEDNGNLSYDIYEVCNDCKESWIIGDFEMNDIVCSQTNGGPTKVKTYHKKCYEKLFY